MNDSKVRLSHGLWDSDERQDIYAELRYDDDHWGNISYDPATLRFHLEIHPSKATRKMDLEAFQDWLTAARADLARLEGVSVQETEVLEDE